MTQLTVRLLGPPQVELDGSPIDVDTRKAIAMLAYLVATRKTHRRSSLALLLWPDSDQARARTALRRTLSALNKAIGKEWIAADRTTIGLDLRFEKDSALWVDVYRFRELIADCQEQEEAVDDPCSHCLPLLAEAADLYRGPFLQGFTLTDSPDFDEWQLFQEETLRQEMSGVLAKLVHCHRRRGTAEAAITYAREWVVLEPLHEPAQRQLMELYAWSGQRSAALHQYQECVRLLDEELGVAPQPETTAVYERIVQGEYEKQRVAQPQPSITPPSRPRHNLPHPTTPFVGREEEKEEIHSLLDNPDCRLVSIVGPGGIGKTRLVLEVAEERLDQYAHGVHFVPFGPVSSANVLVATIADALHFTFYGGKDSGNAKVQLLNFLREKEMLLVIDNFEHLLAGAGLLSEILQHAPGVKILITSQVRLNLVEEWLVEIHGLQCPNGDTRNVENCSAYQLFLQRAHQVFSGFALTEEEKPFVGRICRLVGGMPLGIELASTWVRMLSCQEIASQIEKSLDFLESSLRNLPDRHRSLRAIFERSWQMLSDEERDLFGRLSVFRGGFRVPAATEVAGASLPLLLALADKSLLRRTEAGRYEIPEVLNEYAREKFRETSQPDVEARHTDYYLRFLIEREGDLIGRKQKAALAEIREEVENIRRAWRWSVTNERREAVQQGLTSFYIFFEMQGWFEEGALAAGRAAEQFAAGGQEDAVVGRLRAGQGAFLVRLARYEEGKAALEESLAILRPLPEHRAVAFALYHLGIVAEAVGKYEQARQLQQESLGLYREISDQWGMGNVLNALGNVSHLLQDQEAARRYYQESLAIRRQIDDQRGIALCYHNLGNATQVLGDYDEAKELYRKSVVIKREIGDRRGIGYSLNNLGYVAYLTQAYDEAAQYLEESLATLKEVGDRRGIAYAQMNLGNVAYDQAEIERAQALYRESLLLFRSIGDRAGLAFSLEDLGKVAYRQGEQDEARRWLVEALQTAQAIQLRPVILETLAGLALLLADEAEIMEALRIADTVLAEASLPEPVRSQLQKLVDQQLSEQGSETVEQAGQGQELGEVVTAVLSRYSY